MVWPLLTEVVILPVSGRNPLAGSSVVIRHCIANPRGPTASTAAWLSYTASLPASDLSTPLDVNGVTPPTSETEESRPL